MMHIQMMGHFFLLTGEIDVRDVLTDQQPGQTQWFNHALRALYTTDIPFATYLHTDGGSCHATKIQHGNTFLFLCCFRSSHRAHPVCSH